MTISIYPQTSAYMHSPVVVTIKDDGDYIGVILYSDYATITRWPIPLQRQKVNWGSISTEDLSGFRTGASFTCRRTRKELGTYAKP